MTREDPKQRTGRLLSVDIGGSGVRYCVAEIDGATGECLLGPVSLMKLPPQTDVVRVLTGAASRRSVSDIAVSSAGRIDPAGTIILATSAGWSNFRFEDDLRAAGMSARVVNDAVAHASSVGTRSRTAIIALGTSPAVAILDARSRVLMDEDGIARDYGDLRIKTTAPVAEVWSSVGRIGFEELLHRTSGDWRETTSRFGGRVAALIVALRRVAEFDEVILSGGLSAMLGSPLLETVAANSPVSVSVARSPSDGGLRGAVMMYNERHRLS